MLRDSEKGLIEETGRVYWGAYGDNYPKYEKLQPDVCG